MDKQFGKPVLDKPWLKHYSKEMLEAKVPAIGMYDYVYENNKNRLDSPAINYFGRKISYREFFDMVDRTAKAFVASGVKAGDAVSIVTLSCPDSVAIMYALNRIGALPNYLNVLATEDEMQIFFKESESKIVVTLDLFGKTVIPAAEKTGVKNVIVISLADGMPVLTKLGFKYKLRKTDFSSLNNPLVKSWESFLESGKNGAEITYKKNPEEPAYLGHTGGTTGFPKMVLLCDRSFNTIATYYDVCMKHEDGDSFLSVMIPYVVYSAMINIHMPLVLGLELILVPKFEADKWDEYIKKYHFNHLSSIPAYAAMLLENEKVKNMDLSCIKTFGLGGDGLTLPLENKLNELFATHGSSSKVVKGYGMTEVCATAFTEFAFASKVGSVGLALPSTTVTIFDNDKQEDMGYNEVGEICYRSDAVMLGYKDNEEEMKNLFRLHPDGLEWIHTGDLGYIDEEGFLFIEGRMKRMIMTVLDGKVYKIFPSKVESVLVENTGVKEACVVGAAQGADRVLKAYIVKNSDIDSDKLTAELKKLCDKELQENMRPVYYEYLDDMPRTPAGKVDFKNLENRS